MIENAEVAIQRAIANTLGTEFMLKSSLRCDELGWADRFKTRGVAMRPVVTNVSNGGEYIFYLENVNE
jgi:hypothetical protein